MRLSSLLRAGSEKSVGCFFSDRVGVWRESRGKSDGSCADYIQQQHKPEEQEHLCEHMEIVLGFLLHVCCRNSAHNIQSCDITMGLSISALFSDLRKTPIIPSAWVLTLNYFFGHFKLLMLERCKTKCSIQWSHCITAHVVTPSFQYREYNKLSQYLKHHTFRWTKEDHA